MSIVSVETIEEEEPPFPDMQASEFKLMHGPVNDFGQFLDAADLLATSPKRLRSREVYSDAQGTAEGRYKCYTGEAVISAMALLFVTKDVTMENLMSKLNTIFTRREKVSSLDVTASVTKELKMCIKRMIEAELDEGAKSVSEAIFIWFENRFYAMKDMFVAQISTLITVYSAINDNGEGKQLSSEQTEALISWTLNVILSPLWPLSDAHYCHTLKNLFETVAEIVPVELKYIFSTMSELSMCYNWDLKALMYMKDNVLMLPNILQRFLKSQDFRVLAARVRVLCNIGFFDYALTLSSVIVNELNSSDEYRKSMPLEAALHFRDVFYVLLAKQGSYEKFTVDILRNMQTSSGLHFMRRLAKRTIKDLPISLIPSVKQASSVCSRAFLLCAICSPPEMTENSVMEGLILEWFNNAVYDIQEAIRFFVTKCKYSEHIYSLCKVLEENVHSLKTSELVDLYVEGLKRDVADGSQLKTKIQLRAKIGEVLLKVSGWFASNRNLYREMILCCFSVHPTMSLMLKIRELWTLSQDAAAAGRRFCRCSSRRRSHELCERCGLFGRTSPFKPFRLEFFEVDARESLKHSDLNLCWREYYALAKVLCKVRGLSHLSWEMQPDELSHTIGWHLTNFNTNCQLK